MQYFCFGVSTLRGVAADLPATSQLFRRLKKNAHTIGAAHLLPVHTEQPFHNQERFRNDILWWPKIASFVVIVWFKDWLTGTKQLQVLRHYIKIVAIRIQRRDTQLLALLTIIAMIVVSAEHRDTLRTQNLDDTTTQRRLARSAISYYPQDDRTHVYSR